MMNRDLGDRDYEMLLQLDKYGSIVIIYYCNIFQNTNVQLRVIIHIEVVHFLVVNISFRSTCVPDYV